MRKWIEDHKSLLLATVLLLFAVGINLYVWSDNLFPWEPEGWERLGNPCDNMPNIGEESLGLAIVGDTPYFAAEGCPLMKFDGKKWVEIELVDIESPWGGGFEKFERVVGSDVEGDNLYIADTFFGIIDLNTQTGKVQQFDVHISSEDQMCVSEEIIYLASRTPAHERPSNSFGELYVRRFDPETSQLVDIGLQPVSDGEMRYPSLFVDEGVPYVAYSDRAESYRLTVKSFDGRNWNCIGAQSISEGGASGITLYVENGIPYVAFHDSTHLAKVTVKKFNGEEWVTIGEPGLSTGTELQVMNGVPYLGSPYTGIKKFDGQKWVDLSGPCTDSEHTLGFTMRLDDAGIPYVAFLDDCPGYYSCSRLNVMKYTGD